MHHHYNHHRRKPTRGRTPITMEEAARLRAADAAPRTRALIHAALTTGARRSELVSLRWADIDTVNLHFHIRRGKNRERTVRLTPELVELLNEFRASQDGGSTYVFGNRNGGPSSPAALEMTVRDHTLRVCGRTISLHELRRWLLRRREH